MQRPTIHPGKEAARMRFQSSILHYSSTQDVRSPNAEDRAQIRTSYFGADKLIYLRSLL